MLLGGRSRRCGNIGFAYLLHKLIRHAVPLRESCSFGGNVFDIRSRTHQRGDDGWLAAEGEASVHQDNLSGNVTGIVRTKEDDDPRHVLGLGNAP